MKQEKYLRRLTVLMPVLGGVCFVLRQGLYALALDEKGLLLRRHPLAAALWIVAAAAGAMAAATAWGQKGSDRYEENFGPSAVAAFGHFLLAGGICATVLTFAPGAFGTLGMAWKVLGMLAVPLLVWAGLCRIPGKMPPFWIYGEVCLFLLTHIMNQYQRWCANPQLMDYVFVLMAAIALAFFAYYTAAFAAGCGNRRMHLGSGLLAVLLCIGGLSAGEYPLLYLGGAAWALTDLCRLQPPSGEETAYDAA